MVRVKQKAKKFGYRSSPDVEFEAGLEAKAREARGEPAKETVKETKPAPVEQPTKRVKAVKEEVGKSIKKQTVTGFDELGNPLPEITAEQALDVGIAKGETGVERAEKLLQLGLLGTIGAGTTAISQAAVIGKSTIPAFTRNTAGVITRYATNTKSIGGTTSWLTKLSSSTKLVTTENLGTGKTVQRLVTTSGGKLLSPGLIAGTLLTVIGTYPFAGFIKEEALQTISFAVRTAEQNEDVEGMETALLEELQILEPNLWNKILNSIPFANVLNQLKIFYDAAMTKLRIDVKTLENLRAVRDLKEGRTERG